MSTKTSSSNSDGYETNTETIKNYILGFLREYPHQYFSTAHLAAIAMTSNARAKKALLELRDELKITGGATGYGKNTTESWTTH